MITRSYYLYTYSCSHLRHEVIEWRKEFYSAVFCRPPPSPIAPYANLSRIVGPAVLSNEGRSEDSRTRTDRILSSRPVQGSWQSPYGALRGPRTVENTGNSNIKPIQAIVKVGRMNTRSAEFSYPQYVKQNYTFTISFRQHFGIPYFGGARGPSPSATRFAIKSYHSSLVIIFLRRATTVMVILS